jgi:hypothetical protein
MISKSFLVKAPLIAISAATLASAILMGAARPARADDGDTEQMIQVGAKASAGSQISFGQCPCYRWTIGVKALDGRIETQDILISTDGLAKFQQTGNVDFQKVGARLLTLGNIDMLAKKGHVGIGFKGVTIGKDTDRGFSNLMRAGAYIFANLVKNQTVRADLRTGYDLDQVTTTTSREATRHFITEEAVLTLGDDSQAFEGQLKASVSFNPESFFDSKSMRASTSASARVRIVNIEDLQFGLSAQAQGDYDPFLEVLGLKPFNLTGMLVMDLRYVPLQDHSN